MARTHGQMDKLVEGPTALPLPLPAGQLTVLPGVRKISMKENGNPLHVPGHQLERNGHKVGSDRMTTLHFLCWLAETDERV